MITIIDVMLAPRDDRYYILGLIDVFQIIKPVTTYSHGRSLWITMAMALAWRLLVTKMVTDTLVSSLGGHLKGI